MVCDDVAAEAEAVCEIAGQMAFWDGRVDLPVLALVCVRVLALPNRVSALAHVLAPVPVSAHALDPALVPNLVLP